VTERRPLQILLFALLAGPAAWALSCLVERPLGHGFSFGLTYQQMSNAPFALGGLFPHRILLPLLGNLTGLSGPDFYLAAHASAVLLLVLVAFAAVRFGAGWLDASLLTLACALGGATQLYKSHVGYPDSLSFALLLGAMLTVRTAVWPWVLMLLGALAHEQTLFFAPCLVWLRLALGGSTLRREALPALAIVVLYAGFRWWIHGDAKDDLEPQYYFNNGYFPLGFVGVLYLAMVQVVLVFGIQLIALPFAHRMGVQAPAAPTDRPNWQRPALWLYLLAILAIYAVAHDFNRFVNFLFLPLLVAWRELLRRPYGRAVLVSAMVVQIAVTKFAVMPIVQTFFAPMAECGCLTGVPKELQKLVTFVLPRVWPYVAGAALLLAGLLAAGVALARREIGVPTTSDDDRKPLR
jgi:hypothetical protein